MSESEYGTPKLVVRHEPDHSLDDTGYGQKEKVELPGHVLVGVEIDGVFKPLGKFGKAGLDADIARAKSEKKSKSDTSG